MLHECISESAHKYIICAFERMYMFVYLILCVRAHARARARACVCVCVCGISKKHTSDKILIYHNRL